MGVIPVVRKEPTNPITSKIHYPYHHGYDMEDTVKSCGETTLRHRGMKNTVHRHRRQKTECDSHQTK